MPTYYQCQRCTACCRWPGMVKLTEKEISGMARFLDLSETEFIERYTKVRPDRIGLALKDREDGACILLEGNLCKAQGAKPQQCRDFPNLWNFPDFQKVCQSKAVELSIPDYEQTIRRETGRPDYKFPIGKESESSN